MSFCFVNLQNNQEQRIINDKLYFIVGDVSGKGVPASLVMAVTCRLFRTITSHFKTPEEIMNSLNNALSENNDSNMFCTAFVGILDLQTGNLLYCNAGHNAPVYISDKVASFIDVKPNLPLGLFSGFPREGNGWSHQHARRQWSLAEPDYLRYRYLRNFDKAMIHLAQQETVLDEAPELFVQDEEKKILIFKRKNCIFALNFNPTASFTDYGFAAPAGKYEVVLNTDENEFDGFSRIKTGEVHFSMPSKSENGNGKYEDSLSLYLPNRTAVVLKKID